MTDQELEQLFARLLHPERFEEGVSPTQDQLIGHLLGENDPEIDRWLSRRLAESPEVREDLERLREGLAFFEERQTSLLHAVLRRVGARPRTVDLGSMASRLGKEATNTLRDVLTAIQSLAQGLPHPVAAAFGTRSTAGQVRSVVDQSGKPLPARFNVVRAEVEADGRLIVDLSTGDPAVRRLGKALDIRIRIVHEGSSIVLPAKRLTDKGRVSVTVPLPVKIQVRQIPGSALEVEILGQRETS